MKAHLTVKSEDVIDAMDKLAAAFRGDLWELGRAPKWERVLSGPWGRSMPKPEKKEDSNNKTGV